MGQGEATAVRAGNGVGLSGDAAGLILARLALPFSTAEIEWRIQQAGLRKPREGEDGEAIPWAKCVAYVQSRAVMGRLDQVVGPHNWRDEYRDWKVGNTPGVLCGISIRIDGEWVTKWDGAEPSDIEPIKGALSASLKRAAVKWGIGRYLYNIEEGWARIVAKNTPKSETACIKPKQGSWYTKDFWYSWLPPVLPDWALPDSEKARKPQPGPNGPAQGAGTTRPAQAAPAQTTTTAAKQPTQSGAGVTSGGNNPVPATRPPEPAAAPAAAPQLDPVVECRKILQACGSRTQDDADLICQFVTFAMGAYTFSDAKVDPAKAAVVYMKLRAAAGTREAAAALLIQAREWRNERSA